MNRDRQIMTTAGGDAALIAVGKRESLSDNLHHGDGVGQWT